MSKCSNCGAALSCGCQKRVASDGKSVCTGCIASYEISLATLKKASGGTPIIDNRSTTPMVTGINIKLG